MLGQAGQVLNGPSLFPVGKAQKKQEGRTIVRPSCSHDSLFTRRPRSATPITHAGMNAGTFVPFPVSLNVNFTFWPILMSSRSPQSTMLVITLMPSSSVT